VLFRSLRGELTGHFLMGLLVVKALIWAIALGSGTSGGVLAPLLIMGGALGAVEAQWIHPAEAGLWAMTSMAAMMGGTMRSPLTAVAFMLELTGDIAVLPALLIACAAAHAVTVLLMRRSILTEKVARRGHHVVREYVVNPLARMRVEDAMERDIPVLPADATVAMAGEWLAERDPRIGHRYAWPLVDQAGALAGLLTRGDLMKALEQPKASTTTLLDAGSSALVVTYPDELLEEAVAKMARHHIGRLPVVDRDDPRRLLGYLGRSAIATAWREVVEEEHLREAGWLTSRARLLRTVARSKLRSR